MTALSFAEFFKPSTSNRPDRKLVFLEKYKNKEPFEMNNGNTVVFKYDKAIYNKIAALTPKDKTSYDNIILTGTNSRTYRMSAIKKSKDFGGGTGSGAGAENTKLNESSVCLWCAVYKKTKKTDMSTIVSNYNKVNKLYDVDETDKEMISQKDKVWIEHYERCAIFLVNNYFKTGDYIFHRGSDFVNTINSKFSELNKKLEKPFSNINKWSPADIWVQSKTFTLDLDKINSIEQFNSYLLKLIKSKKLIGVSLKKTLGSIHKENFNMGTTRATTSYNGNRMSAPNKGITGSKDVYIYGKAGAEDISLQLRSFDDTKSFQGEIIGKVAKYGKIAIGPINQILEECGLEQLPESLTVAGKTKIKSPIIIKELYDMYCKHNTSDISYASFLATCKSPNTKSDYIFSKYLGVKLIDILESGKVQQRNQFIEGAIGYALSATKNSAPFIKIS